MSSKYNDYKALLDSHIPEMGFDSYTKSMSDISGIKVNVHPKSYFVILTLIGTA